MRSRAYILALLISVQAPDRAPIEGLVTRAGTGEPVPRATIVVTMVQGQLDDVETMVADDLEGSLCAISGRARIASSPHETDLCAPSSASARRRVPASPSN